MSRQLKPKTHPALNASSSAGKLTHTRNLDGWTPLVKEKLGGWKASTAPKSSQRSVKDPASPDTRPEANIISQSATRKRRRDNGHTVPTLVIDLTDEPLEPVHNKRPRLEGRAPSDTAILEKLSDDLLPAEGSESHCDGAAADFRRLKEQIQHLRHMSVEENTTQAAMIKNLLALVSAVETAVDVREAELRTGLSNLLGTTDDVKEQAMQLTSFSSGISWLVTSLVGAALGRHHALLKDEVQQDAHRRLYENAGHSEDVAVIYK
ncbi:hypothetical protein OEA41_001392 [Lepraria neglecta]|uniref:Uncharacterized protein n=1 Tax=Lepraria neglecta TaxID=209136 RepID=A0AAD9ZD59_9LECA|nr:hypothetical protein OEA41_001392 [Lepraria neglecta]